MLERILRYRIDMYSYCIYRVDDKFITVESDMGDQRVNMIDKSKIDELTKRCYEYLLNYSFKLQSLMSSETNMDAETSYDESFEFSVNLHFISSEGFREKLTDLFNLLGNIEDIEEDIRAQKKKKVFGSKFHQVIYSGYNDFEIKFI